MGADKEQSISFKTARLAKIQGFNWFYHALYYDAQGREWLGFSSNSGDYEDKCIKCSQGMLHKWLMSQHKLYVQISMVNAKDFTSSVISMDNMEILEESLWFVSYEEALEHGLYEALKRVKTEFI